MKFVLNVVRYEISTHTPHARRDYLTAFRPISELQISTHTPHARRDMSKTLLKYWSTEFQLTRLMRGVTLYLV